MNRDISKAFRFLFKTDKLICFVCFLGCPFFFIFIFLFSLFFFFHFHLQLFFLLSFLGKPCSLLCECTLYVPFHFLKTKKEFEASIILIYRPLLRPNMKSDNYKNRITSLSVVAFPLKTWFLYKRF